MGASGQMDREKEKLVVEWGGGGGAGLGRLLLRVLSDVWHWVSDRGGEGGRAGMGERERECGR